MPQFKGSLAWFWYIMKPKLESKFRNGRWRTMHCRKCMHGFAGYQHDTPVTPAKPTRNRQNPQNFQWIGQLSAIDNVAEDTVKAVGFMSGSSRVRFGMDRPIWDRYITNITPIENRSLAHCWNCNRQQTDNPELKPITNRQHTDHKPTQIRILKYAKLTLNRHLFRKWFRADQTTCHYHNECQVRFLTHVCVNRPQWVRRGQW